MLPEKSQLSVRHLDNIRVCVEIHSTLTKVQSQTLTNDHSFPIGYILSHVPLGHMRVKQNPNSIDLVGHLVNEGDRLLLGFQCE